MGPLKTRYARLALAGTMLLACAFASATLAAAASGPSPPGDAPMSNQDAQHLFDVGAEPALRQRAMQVAVKHALAGDGQAAYYLGALYRHGSAHPAKLVEKDLPSARRWLRTCVESTHCPLVALASLAELELEAGDARGAMQWAQAWVVLDRELRRLELQDERRRLPHETLYSGTAYQAFLLSRCYKAMPATADRVALGMQWFDELRRSHGKHLDRMLFRTLDGAQWASSEAAPEFAAVNQRSRSVDQSYPGTALPAMAVYLFQAQPGGGPSRDFWMVDSLPSVAASRGMERLVQRYRTKPYALVAEGRHRVAHLLVSFDDGRYSLTPDSGN